MLEEKIFKDFIEAKKNRNEGKASALSFLRSALHNFAIEKRKEKLDDGDVILVLKKQVKERHDSIEQFKKGNRTDLVDKETKELEILQSYLPKQLTAEELMPIIEEAIKTIGAQDLKQMGQVIKEIMAKTKGQADGKLISDLVKNALTKKPIETNGS